MGMIPMGSRPSGDRPVRFPTGGLGGHHQGKIAMMSSFVPKARPRAGFQAMRRRYR
jgi:hypothetical protein